MSRLKARNPQLFAQIMLWLGFEDNDDDGGGGAADGTNGIPDFLDDWLVRRGLNFDTLPTTEWPIPEPGGDCGGGGLIFVPEDFFDKEPAYHDEFAYVIDGCDNIFIVRRDRVGDVFLTPFLPNP